MTNAEALRALAGMGISRKMAAFLLDEAERHGCGAHLKCEVTYAAGDGFLIVDYCGNDGEGLRVTPGTANG